MKNSVNAGEEVPYPNTDRDLDIIEAVGPLIEDEEYYRATPCVRFTFICDGNLSDREAVLDGWLARAAELARPEVKLYGGSGQKFPYSQRRKPKATDWTLFDGLSQRLLEDKIESTEGNPAAIPGEAGSFFFADTLKDGASATRFYAMGSHPWRITLSLSTALWRRQREEMNRLVEDLAALGDIYDSGGYGFAMNMWNSGLRELDAELYYPISQRFRLVDMVDPMMWRQTKLKSLGAKGVPYKPLPKPLLYPIMPWTLLRKPTLAALDIPEQSLRDLAPDVAEIVEHEHGFLVKLWPEPVLGDVNTDPDLSPAYALGRVLAPAILPNADRFSKGLIGRLGWPEDNASWYKRFVPEEDETTSTD